MKIKRFHNYGNDYVTVQWCVSSERLCHAHHYKGNHGCGGIWGGSDHTTFHDNSLAHLSSRTPRLSGLYTKTPCYNVDLRNNVINWGFNSAYGEGAGTANFMNNYCKPGPAAKIGVRSRIYNPSDTFGDGISRAISSREIRQSHTTTGLEV